MSEPSTAASHAGGGFERDLIRNGTGEGDNRAVAVRAMKPALMVCALALAVSVGGQSMVQTLEMQETSNVIVWRDKDAARLGDALSQTDVKLAARQYAACWVTARNKMTMLSGSFLECPR